MTEYDVLFSFIRVPFRYVKDIYSVITRRVCFMLVLKWSLYETNPPAAATAVQNSNIFCRGSAFVHNVIYQLHCLIPHSRVTSDVSCCWSYHRRYYFINVIIAIIRPVEA